jgi:hypothetical protein
MVRRFRNPLACWTVLALYVLSAGLVGHAVVLCEASNGRAVVEIVGVHGGCLDHVAVGHGGPAGVHSGAVGCDARCCADRPCEDTPLTPQPAPVENNGWAILPPPAVQRCLDAPGPASRRTEDVRAVDRVTRRSLRSVVLLV